ncbi:A/G-specific adenine glycosylase [Rhodoferax sp.]|uniref:A/G-specific adenine glycosylase n=1 Tax=Rhodoferax sp. TaxID=50421 RepID=UPI002725BAE7|nr:A/G-specific adenine glycosylase [Rhodoferax sp.]MDO9143272.1 A/G-specific adenine glycosylase [Rhodoferax sp.]
MDDFLAIAVVRWQAHSGRHDLPWQNTRDPYRVWLSEIMLQQTQVTTVQDYFARFLARFADVQALAQAPLDEVLHLWAGLGYYSRARNLHRCAQDVERLHGGAFPRTAQQLQTLPGIGRSTAAAIAALCFGERVAILDGNVKRVLTRYLGFADDLALALSERRLWDLATELLPKDHLLHNMARYTQGMMDLGATLCTTKKPACPACPLSSRCVAHALASPEKFPVKTRKLKRSAESIWLLWAVADDGAVWLSQRPTPGVWAGLYCLPLFADRQALQAALDPKDEALLTDAPAFKHVLTHKDLYLHPVLLRLQARPALALDGRWFDAAQMAKLGLPAPIKKMLDLAGQATRAATCPDPN